MAKQIKSFAKLAALCLVLWTARAARVPVNVGSLTHYLGDGETPGAEDGVNGLLNRPTGCVVTNSEQTLLIADSVNNAIRSVDLSGRTLDTAIGTLGTSGYDLTTGTNAMIGTPLSMVVDAASENLYFTDFGNNMIIRATVATGQVSAWAGMRDRGYVNAVGDAARFNGTSGLAWNDAGELLVSERDGNRIRRVLADRTVSLVAGSESGEAGFMDGVAEEALFSEPNGLAFHNGVLYVADSGNHRIRAVLADGNVTTVAGTGAEGNDDGAALSATFVEPYGLTVDPDGMYLYIADKGNNEVRRMSFDTMVVETVAGNLEAGWTSNTTATNGRIAAPQGVCFSSTRMYVTGDHSVSYVILGSNEVGSNAAPDSSSSTSGSSRGSGSSPSGSGSSPSGSAGSASGSTNSSSGSQGSSSSNGRDSSDSNSDSSQIDSAAAPVAAALAACGAAMVALLA